MTQKRKSLTVKLDVTGPRPPQSVRWAMDGPILYVAVSAAEVARTVEVSEDLIADYDSDGNLIGFEIIGALRSQSYKVPDTYEKALRVKQGTAEPGDADRWVLQGAGAAA